MGYLLRRLLRDALGPDITGLQRSLALEITDDARDETRLSFASLEDLARWVGAKDVDVVRTTLKRLGAAGWEFRVPLGVGKDGRVLYAVPGKRLSFRVPDFEGRTTVTPKGEPPLPLPVQGGTTVPTEGTPVPKEGTLVPSEGTPVTPFSSVPSAPSLPSEAGAASATDDEREISPEEQILAAYTQALGRPVVAAVRNKIHDQAGKLLADGLPLWWLIGRAKELPDFGTDLTKHCEMSRVPVEVQRPDGLVKPCTTHPPFSRMIPGPDGDLINCPACHPDELARQLRQGAA